jgi:hypothetical protein
MYSRCAPSSLSSVPFCWEHSEIKRPDDNTEIEMQFDTGERKRSPVFSFGQSRHAAERPRGG